MLKKSMIELCILQLLIQQDMYGYEILHKLKSVFPNTKESEIYVLLRGMFRNKLTECYEGKESDGPVRKYYKITPLGQKRKEELEYEWQQLCSAMRTLEL